MAPASERRVDPDDGVAYTLEELLDYYKGKFKKKAILSYWEEECELVKAKAMAESKAKAKAKAKDKVRADTKAEPNAKAKAAPKPKAKAKASPTPEGKPGAAAAAVAVTAAMKRREKDWRVGGVVYQVFVDRFAPPADMSSERKALFPSPCTLHTWAEPPKRGELVKEVGYWAHELQFWGGDLSGLCGKLDYLEDLGTDVLYLQPICKAYSNHKYDATDYKDLDPQYGTLDDFKSLVDKAHGKDMKLVLDGVFNHMGKRNDCVQEALAADSKEASAKKDWFYLGDRYPLGYKTWGCADNLVELRLESKSIQEYIWKGKESVVATWLKRGADGWRLDVAQEIGFDHLQAITAAAHRHKRGSLVVGEVWAYPPRWTSAMDGVLNLHLGVLIYGVTEGKYPGPSAAQSIAGLISDSSTEEVLKSWIVLSNHDMPRLAHRLPDIQLRKFVQVLQFTLPGCPLIYYGDEIGMAGGDDPDNRAPFQWERASEDNEMFAHTKKLVQLRRRLRGLRIGDYRALAAQKLLAFARLTDRVSETVVVLANPTDAAVEEMVTVPDPRILGYTLFQDELSGEEIRILGATVTVEVKPKSVRIFAMRDESDNPSGAQYKRMYGHWATFPGVRP